jgi:hypothetical protein
MTAADSYTSLTDRGVVLTVVGDRLRYAAPPGVLTDADRALLAQFKVDLLLLVDAEAAAEPPVDEHDDAPAQAAPSPALAPTITVARGEGETPMVAWMREQKERHSAIGARIDAWLRTRDQRATRQRRGRRVAA